MWIDEKSIVALERKERKCKIDVYPSVVYVFLVF